MMQKLLWPDCSIERHELDTDLILLSSGVALVAALSNTKLIGFAEISIRKDHVEGTTESPVPYLVGCYVDPGFRGRGIGKSLIKAAEDFALTTDFKELASDVLFTSLNKRLEATPNSGAAQA